jgi:hypothetical protein
MYFQLGSPRLVTASLVSAMLLSGASLVAQSDSIELGGDRELVVRDSTDHVSDEVGAVHIYKDAYALGASLLVESNDTGNEARTSVLSVAKAAGFWNLLDIVGFHGHVTGAEGSGYGVVGSFGGYVDVDETGINAPSVWGALGGEIGSAPYGVISFGEQYSTAGTLWTTSDARLKRDVEQIEGALGIVQKLRPSSFRFRSEARGLGLQLPEAKRYGFVAQELEAHLPSLVREGGLPVTAARGEQGIEWLEDGASYKSIEILGLIPILTRALQEIDSKYETALAEMARENENLRMRLAELERNLERRTPRFASASGQEEFVRGVESSTMSGFLGERSSAGDVRPAPAR